jgi:hypothetical protein
LLEPNRLIYNCGMSEMATPPRRHWIQFGLRQRFATVTLAAISIGGMQVASKLADDLLPIFLPALALGLGSIAIATVAVAVLYRQEKIVALASSGAVVLAFVGYAASDMRLAAFCGR